MTVSKLLFNSRNKSDCYHYFFYYLKRIIPTHKCNYFRRKICRHKLHPQTRSQSHKGTAISWTKAQLFFWSYLVLNKLPVCLFFIFSSSFFGIECFFKKEGFLLCIFLPPDISCMKLQSSDVCMKRIRNMSSLIADEALRQGWAGEAQR